MGPTALCLLLSSTQKAREKIFNQAASVTLLHIQLMVQVFFHSSSYLLINIPEMMEISKFFVMAAMDATFFHMILFFFSLLIILLSIILRKKKKKKTDMNHMIFPPTLPSLPILGHLHLFTKPLHQTLTDLTGRLGPVISLRFGSRPVVIISSPELAELCLTTHGAVALHRSAAGVTDLLFSHCLRSAADIHDDETRQLLRGLFREAEAAAAEWSAGGAVKVELNWRLFEMGVDAVMRMVAGKKYYGEGAVTAEEGSRFREAVEELFGLRRVSNVGELMPWLSWVDMVEVGQRLPRFRDAMDELLQELVEEHRGTVSSGEEEGEADEKSIITILLSLQTTDPENYNDSFIKNILTSFIIAGTESISNTIEWAISLLLNNPEKLKKARTEIDDLIGGGQRLLSASDLPNLPYLRCIISETLRLYPAAPLLVAHESSNECVIDGYDVPTGTMLLVNVYSIHRNPEVWQEPAQFVPERFQSSRAEGSVVLPFGLGRRRCPGEGLANRAVGLVLGSMIQCFEWERVGSEEVDMVERASMTLPKAVPLQAVCTPRPLLEHVLERL